MADDLTETRTVVTPAPSSPTRDGGRLGRRGEMILGLAAAAFLLAAMYFGWRAYFHQAEGDPVASAMQAFEKQNDLIVLTYRFQVVAESVIKGPMGISALERSQLVIIPAMVEYRIEFSGIAPSDMTWDKQVQTLTVSLPDLRISRPNLDEARARAFTDGLWVSRGDAEALARKNSQIAERRALEYAKDKEILAIARNAAREAVRQNLAIPLQVAGFDRAQVEVRFANGQ
ncbi:MAG: DUF4230 domain-containing protein [Erythrobacter sp.]